MVMVLRIVTTFVALALASSSPAPPGGGNPVGTPRISIRQLRRSVPPAALLPSSEHAATSSSVDLRRLLFESRGILRIAVGDGDDDVDDVGSFLDLRRRALTQLCECAFFEAALESHPSDLRQITLPDGTVRRTLATASVVSDHRDDATTALEIPSWVRDVCGDEAYDSFEGLRRVVAEAVDAFVERLDREDGPSDGGGGEDRNHYRSILSSADHLEHFHLYAKPSPPSLKEDEQEEGTPTLDYHTDAGFFLSFVPAMNCHSRAIDNNSFYLEGPNDPATFQEDEVVILMGAGAQHWLPERGGDGGGGGVRERYPLRAASHALRLLPGARRAWYGRMHLLPSSLASAPAEALRPLTPVENGLGGRESDSDSPRTPSPGRRRRLRHVNSAADCNNRTNFFCWHQCVDVPPDGGREDGQSLYCLDPAMLSSSGLSVLDAAASCKGGYAHNSKCVASWQEADGHVPVYGVSNEANEKKSDPSGKVDEEGTGEGSSRARRIALSLVVCGLLGGAYAVGFSIWSRLEYRRLP